MNKKNMPSGLSIPKEYSLERIGLTQSMITSFMSCRMKLMYALNGFRAGRHSQALNLGTLFHYCIEGLYSLHGVIPSDVEKWVVERIDHWEAETEERNLVADVDFEYNRTVLPVILKHYMNVYLHDFTHKNFICVEYEFSQAYLRNFLLRGKIDALFTGPNGKLYLMEHKIKGRIDNDGLLNWLSMDFQTMFYLFCAELAGLGKPRNMIYNIIRSPQLKITNAGLGAFREKLDSDMAKRPEFYFVRHEVVYTQKDMLIFEKELKNILNAIQDYMVSSTHRFRNTGACLGAYKCGYLKNCSEDTLDGLKKHEKFFPELNCGL